MKMKQLHIWLIILSLGLVVTCSKNSDSASPDGTNPDAPVVVDKSGNLLPTGASANDILSNDNFTKIKIEIAYVIGYRPTTEALDEFVSFLRTHTFKEDIELIFNELSSPGKESLTIQEIADLETENRTVYNDGETLGVYIYFADAPSDGDDEDEDLVTLGAVYRNTTMVIHELTIRQLAGRSSQISTTDIETATINHEFGHLFGLVNLGTPAVNNHEDEDAENHCNVAGCLMRAQLQFNASASKLENLSSKNELKSSCSLSGNSVLQMLETNTSKGLVNAVPLDPECVLDLQSNGGR